MRDSLPDDEVVARVEAALYSSGRPLSVDELIKASGTGSKERALRVANDLVKKSKSVFRAIEIAQLDDGTFVFQLKPEYTPLVRRFAQHPLIPSAALKTLSYIAYEQPVTSKRLAQIRGSQVYTHLKELQQLQFIEHESLGRLKVYRTTKKFQEYFGIADISAMKSKLVSSTDKHASHSRLARPASLQPRQPEKS
ncbi:MAG: SMC-Scp complex subunit ScpB [Nitrososphaera sp.]